MIYYINQSGTTHVKIGYTKKSAKSRLKELQTGSSFKLELLGFEDGDKTLEKELHSQFASSNILLEWFDCTDELLERINNISNYYVLKEDNRLQIYRKMKNIL